MIATARDGAAHVAPDGARVYDRLGRSLTDLRVSVTDRCNLRCGYCMPRSSFAPGHAFLHRSALLTPAEIERAVAAFMRCGVRRVRLTGGEPLLRRDLCDIVRRLIGLGLDEVALTTNGALLSRHAHRLRRAGLDRITVSLDTLDEATFRTVSDVKVALQTVLDGIAAAEHAGFAPLKLNCVVRKGVNDGGLDELVTFARERGHTLRFIEYMDVGNSNDWRRDQVVTAEEILDRVSERHPLVPLPPVRPGEVARRHRFVDGGGEIGVIASVTEPFCAECTRLRLSADGRMYTCLFAHRGHDLATPLRDGATLDELAASIEAVWRRRSDRYSELRSQHAHTAPRVEMSYIGG